jgi:hypothetical protein
MHSRRRLTLFPFGKSEGALFFLKFCSHHVPPQVLNDSPQVSNVFHKGVPNSITLFSHKSNNLSVEEVHKPNKKKIMTCPKNPNLTTS